MRVGSSTGSVQGLPRRRCDVDVGVCARLLELEARICWGCVVARTADNNTWDPHITYINDCEDRTTSSI
jgi:hypothetical protein